MPWHCSSYSCLCIPRARLLWACVAAYLPEEDGLITLCDGCNQYHTDEPCTVVTCSSSPCGYNESDLDPIDGILLDSNPLVKKPRCACSGQEGGNVAEMRAGTRAGSD